ncbi:MAG: hypothetical protein ACLPX1_03315 [Steroidobacteraceae bacterium]
MATPADQRLLELLEKWLKSLELHLRYSSLDADSYSRIQAWPEHQRPSRWIIELATQKALALRAQVQERVKMGDVKFSDSLELMTFLANLIGSEHIERFIPLADPENERPLTPAPSAADTSSTATTTATREMPKFIATKPQAPAPVATTHVARTERKPGAARPVPKTAPKQPARLHPPARHAAAKPAADASAGAAREQVIADAVRLVQWGRKWFELAELIARMADRPPLPEVRRILKDNKTAIEEKAGHG